MAFVALVGSGLLMGIEWATYSLSLSLLSFRIWLREKLWYRLGGVVSIIPWCRLTCNIIINLNC
jgi:hypothetical protein